MKRPGCLRLLHRTLHSHGAMCEDETITGVVTITLLMRGATFTITGEASGLALEQVSGSLAETIHRRRRSGSLEEYHSLREPASGSSVKHHSLRDRVGALR